ncbi:MAG: response regulator [Planctomycetes bacterium]|nr:response regulator [Planctomycetota bacterium]
MATSKGKTVMVVDDDLDVRLSVTRLLVRHGYDVLSAQDGAEALKILYGDTRVDLIVLDIMMPYVTGLGLLIELPELRRRSIPVILLTARAAPGDISDGCTKGAQLYITKPFDPRVLVDAVDFLLGMGDPKEMARIEAELLTADNVYYGIKS